MQQTKFKEEAIQYLQKYYGKRNKVPSARDLFKSFNKTKFYEAFPKGLAQACKLAGIPVPEERLKRTQKARRAKRVEKEASPLQDLKQSYQIQQREEQRRKELAEKRAEELAILLQDPNEAINRPVLDAIERTALPILLKKKYGIDASVPEILDMLKQYKQAKDEGWYVEDVMEWGVLSEEEREAFRELYNKAYSEEGVNPTSYLVTLKGAMENLKRKKDQLLREIGELNQKKKDLNWDYSLLKTRHSKLDKDHEKRKKHLEDEYYEKARDYAIQFSKVKKQFENEINKLINERNRLQTKCEKLEKTASSIVNSALQQHDRIKAQIAEGRAELKELAKQNEEIKAQLAERNQQLT